jgi:transmembrane sensor
MSEHELNQPSLRPALARVNPRWDDGRTEAGLRGLGRKRTRRAVMRATAATAGVALLVGGGLWWKGRDNHASPAPILVAQPAPVAPAPGVVPERSADLVLGEGFVVTPEEGADVSVIAASGADQARVRITSGKSRFRVEDPHTDAVSVQVGELTITTYARVFSVARSADATDVWTHEGTLAVVWKGEELTLPAGTHRRFAEAAADDAPSIDPAPAAPRDRPIADWRAPARDGDHQRAYRLLRRAGNPGTSVADLMLAADVYRLSGHAAEAVTPLERVVAKHRADPRAPLASFTLGRVLLDELGRPIAAARAFADARAIDPKGALAEDALAREVEAWAKGGNAGNARRRAELYLDLYPVGHRQHAVEQYGGL